MRMNRAFQLALALIAFVCAAPTAQSQSVELRGVVRDSASNAPVAGTVVVALDGVGTTLGRTLTNARGQYRLTMPNGALLLRAVRIGYRAATQRIPLSSADVATVDLVIATVPLQLQTFEVAGARGCPVRADQAQAASMLEQARAGLLATVVARERSPAKLVVLRYDRELDLNGIEIESQTVRVDSSANVTTSFNASRNAVDFVTGGFRTGRVGQYTYFGPDADVLLDERFQRGYCFTIAARDSIRPTQIGLHFAPADSRNGRVDIDGTLWIDTTARSLTEITYRYVGIEALGESFNAGGRVSFVTLPSGVPFIDRWNLRLVGGVDESASRLSSQVYTIRETGGELARATWPDGESWTGPHGTVSLTAIVEGGAPSKNVRLNLAGTDYRAQSDSSGRAAFAYVLPGPYTIAVDDAALSPIGVQLPAGKSLLVARNTTTLARITVPTAVQVFAPRCGSPAPTNKNVWIIARVFGADGLPAVGAHWRVSLEDRGRWKVVSENGITGSDGLIVSCKSVPRDARYEVAAWRDPKDAIRVQRTATDLFNVARVTLPAAVVVARAPAPNSGAATITAMGTVADSLTGVLVPNARVTFVGTPFEGATDMSGTFLVGGITPGTYTVEVSTPALDSVGVVARRSLTLDATQADAIKLFVPSHASILASACGATNVGFVAGTIAMRGDGKLANGKIPDGLRVVAEWQEAVPDSVLKVAGASNSRTLWTGAEVSANGTFRVCGVPAGQRVVLHTESDSVIPWNARPQTLSLFADRQFARVDLLLDSTETATGTLVGTVVGDTTGTKLENVEVSITNLNRTVYTDRRGAFRINDVPLGSHLITVRRVGYAAYTTPVELVANRVEDLAVSLNRMSALATIAVEADPTLKEFNERRATGIGRYLTRADLEKVRGRKLGDLVTQVGGFGVMSTGAGGRAYIVGKRAPAHILTGERGTLVGVVPEVNRDRTLGPPKKAAVEYGAGPINLTTNDIRDMGIYCPTEGEKRANGVPSCSCFAQIYVDGRLMNPERPTEPYDLNTLVPEELAGVEFYATPASTPGRYSNLNSKCGVMLVWTRRDQMPARTSSP